MASASVNRDVIDSLISVFNDEEEDFLGYLETNKIVFNIENIDLGQFEYYQLEYVCIAEYYVHDLFNETVRKAMEKFVTDITSKQT